MVWAIGVPVSFIKFLVEGVRYLFADSSPQAGYDWLISSTRAIKSDCLVSTFEVMRTLVRGNTTRKALESERDADLDLDADEDEPSLDAVPVDRAQLFKQLMDAIKTFTFPPVALGVRHGSLSDKVSALMCAMFLDVSHQNLKVQECQPTRAVVLERRRANWAMPSFGDDYVRLPPPTAGLG